MGKLRPDDLEVTERHVQNFFEQLDVSKPVEIFNLIDRFQLDVTTEVYFGESANSLKTEHSPFREAMEKLFAVNTTRTLAGFVKAGFDPLRK